MQLPGGLGKLTYCLNIHPTQSWAEARAALSGPVAAVKAALSPSDDFGAGLRFSAETMDELSAAGPRAELADLLASGGLDPFTMNGFPYGPFHGTRVKEQVYLPDWRAEERIAYTNALAGLLAELNPEGAFISLSTVPCAFRPNGVGQEAAMAANLIRSAAHMVELERSTGRHIAIAIEPEPCCFLETIEETVAYFQDHLFSADAAAQLASLTGLSQAQAEAALPRHLGLCYDVCHAAVEYEDPAGSIEMLRGAGIPVHKLQLSSALRIAEGADWARGALARFAEPTYLHQLIARDGSGALTRYTDLPEALKPGGAEDGAEWRVHFHVPVFLETLPEFDTTQAFLRDILALHRAEPISPHLEVETYTWDVLPADLVAGSVEEAVTRELNWVLGELSLCN
ncbi:MAG: metabolite traffic protein EboE [Pseudomonadota bacterium]